jgi:hypothetical protein
VALAVIGSLAGCDRGIPTDRSAIIVVRAGQAVRPAAIMSKIARYASDKVVAQPSASKPDDDVELATIAPDTIRDPYRMQYVSTEE